MEQHLATAGRLIGALGILVCVIAGVTRLTGLFYVAGISAGMLLQGGMAGVVIGCYLLLAGKSGGNYADTGR